MTQTHRPEGPHRPCTAFHGDRQLARGPLSEVALAVKAAAGEQPSAPILTFDDQSGAVVDLDLRGSAAEVLARLAQTSEPASGFATEIDAASTETGSRGRGRPKLGVVAREVTLLPRHWDWLATQPGGASPALRRLVDEARLRDGGESSRRLAREAAYRFMSAMAGDRAGFEEASRALFAGDEARFLTQAAAWPADIRDHAHRLAWKAARPA
ncbi:MAG TPA: DUF2239 family protein [Bosea sp. (in: a-proteobacteria)]|jgi:hypothetical protein|uniref:DUF2239 family protein n=1 Tax=Bosea sp. (in: a-proteobacteria) TaxID=1871050 RepID=UPI002E150C09|nr:DUF2239 family protein [Bosea sp. (in: a-proteobacteria)]